MDESNCFFQLLFIVEINLLVILLFVFFSPGPASGSSDDWAYAVAQIPFVYTLELRDTGEHGFMLPAEEIVPSGEEIFAGIMAAAEEIVVIVDREILAGDDGRGEESIEEERRAKAEEKKRKEKERGRLNKKGQPSKVKTPNRFKVRVDEWDDRREDFGPSILQEPRDRYGLLTATSTSCSSHRL
jgi:hypothetical protein